MGMSTCKFTLALYKYFSYRMMWTDDAFEKCEGIGSPGWIGVAGPHGVLPLANVLSMPALNAFTKVCFIGAGASVVFRTPFLRYMTCLGGACDVSSGSIKQQTFKGHCVGIVPDGIAGIFKNKGASAQDEIMALKNRKGLARLSLKTGIPLVPAYSLGNTAVYKPWFDSYGIMERASRALKMSLFGLTGRFGLPVPQRANVTLLLGVPMLPAKIEDAPSETDITKFHEELLANITTLFDEHKGPYGWGDRHMRFV